MGKKYQNAWVARFLVYSLLLSTVWGFATNVPEGRGAIDHQVSPRENDILHPVYPVEYEADGGAEFVVPRKTPGQRRPKPLHRMKRLLPSKRTLTCLAIAVTAILRGPPPRTNEFDPNVAHAGINVKVSGVRVEATIKENSSLLLPVRLPPRSEAPKAVANVMGVSAPPKSKRDIQIYVEPVSELVQKAATTMAVPGTILISAGGGVFAGNYSRRRVKEVNGQGGEWPTAAEDIPQEEVLEVVEEPLQEEPKGWQSVLSRLQQRIDSNRAGSLD